MPNQYEYSKLFFQRWYRPQYTTVIVAGDVTADAVLPLVEKYWGGWTGGTATPADIPKEPAPAAPMYVHVPWTSDTLPWVTVAFHGPAFSTRAKDYAAIEMLSALYFGPTSELYKRLVIGEQKVDALFADTPTGVDPSLLTIGARLKKAADATYVRDAILQTFATARETTIPAEKLEEAKSYNRYAFARTLDSTERIAAVLSRYAAYERSFDTVNELYAMFNSLAPSDLQQAARKYFVDTALVVATLSKESLPEGIGTAPALASFKPSAAPAVTAATETPLTLPQSAGTRAVEIPTVVQQSPLPQLNVKLLFTSGSAHDPAGKEGLATLAADMVADAGSKGMTIDDIRAALYPMAGAFNGRVDKEMTTFTGVIHRDNWQRFLGIVLPQLLEPAFRHEDFTRIKEAQLNALVQDLRSNNEEELGKERLQTNIFRGTPYGHVALGTIAGLNAITLEDVKQFVGQHYTLANLTLGVNGDAPSEMMTALKGALAALPAGTRTPRVAVAAQRRSGKEVEILEKDTRATAISFGFPIEVTRNHPDFAALSVARVWLGEHRASSGRLYNRIRQVRGMNYGDYAYIEAFPRGMYQFFPDPNIGRQKQIFEIWIRPVVPGNAHMALRIAVHELDGLVKNGLTREDFEASRGYLMKNVYVMTARQDQQLGYALDSKWYGIGEFTQYMRDALGKLTLEQVNAAVRKYLTAEHLSIVMIARDAAGLKAALASDAPSAIRYDGERPEEILAEDKIIGALKLDIPADRIAITPIERVFADAPAKATPTASRN
jgi:zinc protease